MALFLLPGTPGSPAPPEGAEGYTVASGANAARPWPFISASVVSPTLQTGTVLTRGWKMLGQVSIGELRMPLQLFTSLVNSSTPENIVGGGVFKSQSPNLGLSAADNALRSGSSSPAPRTRESKSMVSSRPSLGAARRAGRPRSMHVASGATALGLGPGLRHSFSQKNRGWSACERDC